jgi:nucleoside 2-deoxyribosyltransferase
MTPGERIEVIKRIATRLGAEDDWAEIDLILEQFGFPTEWRWEGDAKSYVLHCIKNNDDANLEALDQYLTGHSRPDEKPWDDGRFRLFITHLAKHKATAHALKSHLRFYGIDGFVAHDDIKPGKEWQLVIESALHSCDALVALLHDGFRESDWCDQEVGFALGRGVPVVPLHFDLYPYGFFGSVQAIRNAGTQEVKALARDLTLILVQDKRTADKLTMAVVEQLADATSFDQANRLSSLLANEAPLLTQDQADRLRTAKKTNTQLEDAFGFDTNLSTIEAKILAASPQVTTYEPSEAPF